MVQTPPVDDPLAPSAPPARGTASAQATGTPPCRLAPGFSPRVPEAWTGYGIDGSDLLRTETELRAEVGDDAEARRELDRMFQAACQMLGRARGQGASRVAGTFVRTEDGYLLADAVVFTTPPPVVPPRPGESVDPAATARELMGGDRSRPVSDVTLSCGGTAVRVAGVEDEAAPDTVRARMFAMHTVIPVPGSDRLAVVSCSSPHLSLAQPLYDLFESISDTFELTSPAATTTQDL